MNEWQAGIGKLTLPVAPKRFLRARTEHELRTVAYRIQREASNDTWPADEFQVDVLQSRVIMVVRIDSGVPVHVYNANDWHGLVMVDVKGDITEDLAWMTEDEIKEWEGK